MDSVISVIKQTSLSMYRACKSDDYVKRYNCTNKQSGTKKLSQKIDLCFCFYFIAILGVLCTINLTRNFIYYIL